MATLWPNVALADAAHNLTVDCAPLTACAGLWLSRGLLFVTSGAQSRVTWRGEGGRGEDVAGAGTKPVVQALALRLTCGH